MDNMETVLLGARIKELRKNKGYTQDKFSELLDVDPKHLSRIECGKTPPSLTLIRKMCEILDVEIIKLFENKHLQGREELLDEINKILKNSDLNKIKLFYKIISSI